jgi:hypothetical protein
MDTPFKIPKKSEQLLSQSNSLLKEIRKAIETENHLNYPYYVLAELLHQISHPSRGEECCLWYYEKDEDYEKPFTSRNKFMKLAKKVVEEFKIVKPDVTPAQVIFIAQRWIDLEKGN